MMEPWIRSSMTTSYRNERKFLMSGGAEICTRPLDLVLKLRWPRFSLLGAFSHHRTKNQSFILIFTKHLEILECSPCLRMKSSFHFTPELIAAGKEIAQNLIKELFLCAHLRLLVGQFRNHWKATFSALAEKLQSLRSEREGNNDNGLIHIFIMTDLPNGNWTGTYPEDIGNDTKSFKLYTLTESDERVVQAAKRVVAAEHGLKSGFLPRNISMVNKSKVCGQALLKDILLYIEKILCSCASVGFVGTAGSTIAENILLMRKNNICKL